MPEPITMWSEPLTFMAVESGTPGPAGPAGPAGPQYGLRCSVSSIVRGLVAPISPTSIEFKALVNNADGTQEEVECGTDFRIELTQTSWDEESAQTVNSIVDSVLIGYGTGQTAAAYTTKTVNLNYVLRDSENDQIILEDRSYTRTGGNSDVSAIRASLYKGDIVLVEMAIPFVLANELIDLGMIDESGQVVIGNGRVVASSIVANSVTAEKIAAEAITADKLFGNRLDSIQPPPSFPSVSYVNEEGVTVSYTDTDHFTSEGARIDLSNGGSIHFKNFYIDPTGNISFKGDIEARSGAIVGRLGLGQAVNGEYPIYIDGSPDSQYSFYVNGNFMVTPDGDMTANSGKIAGWLIEENQLVSENHSTGMYSGSALTKEGSPVRFFAGKSDDDYNFVVNDAGYVFAKNAQIQGRIDASSGSITGPLWVGPTTNGVLIDGENGSLQSTPFASSAVGWKIDKDGNAEFNNATVRGKLTSVIFEMSTVSSVGGDLYIAPTVDIPKEKASAIDSDTDNYILLIDNIIDERSKYMDSSWNNSQVKINLTAALNNGKEIAYSGLNGSLELLDDGQLIDITISKNDSENKRILALQAGESLASVVNTITVLKLGVGNNRKYIYLTASSNNSPFIDVQDYDVSDTTALPKVRMGRLDGITDDVNGFGTLNGYGLYCNRAYLTGALNLPNAGITNQGSVGYNGGDTYLSGTEASPVRMWAGGTDQPQAGGEAAPFIVTQDGSLYASKGVFKGQVIATNSEFSGSIRAAGILIDKGGDGYEPQKASNHFFVGYKEEPTTFDDYVLDMNSAGLSIWEGGLRAYSDEMSGWEGGEKTGTAVLPYGYAETNKKPYPYMAAIDAGRLMTKDWHNLTIAENYSAYSIGTKDGKLYFGHTGATSAEDQENYLAYEDAQYAKITGYGYLGVDEQQNLTLQSIRQMNVNGTQVNMSAGQVYVKNPAGKAEISLSGAIMRQAIDEEGKTIGLDFMFE